MTSLTKIDEALPPIKIYPGRGRGEVQGTGHESSILRLAAFSFDANILAAPEYFCHSFERTP